ncbi:MAG: GAF domain-containing protein [Bacilli bacterium]|jgi:GAF domain-containing protein|nr:GAF domain-containing protein [Bacilli bacterium]
MNQKLQSLLNGVEEDVTILSLSAAFLYHELLNVNWLGFYCMKKDYLTLGPFQGLPACIKIPLGKGACGRVAQSKAPLIIPDVRLEANYIACHTETQSELVLPILVKHELFAVLDIDSLSLNRFNEQDQMHLMACCHTIATALQKNQMKS